MDLLLRLLLIPLRITSSDDGQSCNSIDWITRLSRIGSATSSNGNRVAKYGCNSYLAIGRSVTHKCNYKGRKSILSKKIVIYDTRVRAVVYVNAHTYFVEKIWILLDWSYLVVGHHNILRRSSLILLENRAPNSEIASYTHKCNTCIIVVTIYGHK